LASGCVVLEPSTELLEMKACSLNADYFFHWVVEDKAINGPGNWINTFIFVVKAITSIRYIKDQDQILLTTSLEPTMLEYI
jgi:hypothetical protein